MQQRFDVVIVGAGVAGSVAALLYARAGLNVLIADRKPERDSYKALCTHFLQPSARPVLAKLGIEDAITAIGGVPTKAAFWTRAGWIDPPGDYGSDGGDGRLVAYNIERRLLDPYLLGLLEAEPGVDVRIACEVSLPRREADGLWRLDLSQDGKRTTVEARLLVASDGRRSPLAGALGNHPVVEAENQRACVFAYYEGIEAPANDRSLFMLGDREMAFLYPLGGTRALLAAYVAKETAAAWAQDGDKSAKLLEFFATFPGVPDLGRAVLASRVYGYLDYPNQMRRPVHDGVPFIGDAVVSLDPMSGVGCGFAMTAADLLVEATAEALTSGADLAPALEAYARRHQETFAGHAQGIIADSVIAKSPETIEAVYGRICGDAGLQRDFIALTGRLIAPAQFQRSFLIAGAKSRATAPTA
ncbi:NAD(P)/FAD-dependent oxidoreductase [Azospirillum soli]|uniref:NAD(P)/FAD-dependent oxidoreductase n=1 Tax=Azospirillum soli TaxID=1304799 RepID=UPI001AE3BD46|nr:NAD(P)/FAD-dependent oxidoreductase [Azospirillum soli]MBP2314300.1 flavin-dependent dehydrogenase [Azospirillum soli]